MEIWNQIKGTWGLEPSEVRKMGFLALVQVNPRVLMVPERVCQFNKNLANIWFFKHWMFTKCYVSKIRCLKNVMFEVSNLSKIKCLKNNMFDKSNICKIEFKIDKYELNERI